jgi:hypothetical protein
MNPAATRSRTPEPPYCWQSKEALRQIERTYDSESSTRLACAAYLALTRIASDKQAEFTTLQSHPLTKWSPVRTIQRASDLRQLGVIDYITPRRGR